MAEVWHLLYSVRTYCSQGSSSSSSGGALSLSRPPGAIHFLFTRGLRGGGRSEAAFSKRAPTVVQERARSVPSFVCSTHFGFSLCAQIIQKTKLALQEIKKLRRCGLSSSFRHARPEGKWNISLKVLPSFSFLPFTPPGRPVINILAFNHSLHG